MTKDMFFYHLKKKHEKQLLETGLDASKNVVHKAGEFLENKISDVVTKSKDYNIEKQEPVEEMIIIYQKV